MSLKKLESQIRYKYKDINLLELALVHKSSNNKNNNERLEFLGDSILNLIISDYLFCNFPHANEGLLSRMRSFIVKGDTLAKKASELGLLNFIKLSKGTANLSDQRKHSILEGSIESIIGSVYLDGGWTEANRFVLNLFKKNYQILSLIKNLETLKQNFKSFYNQKR